MTTRETLILAKESSTELSLLSTEEKNKMLISMAECLVTKKDEILLENQKDIENAKGNISDVMIDRLRLTEARILDMAKGIRDVANLPDPCGKILYQGTLDNGLQINKVSVPLGVVAIIYESRPNVTSDAAALGIKSGNSVVLRIGKEAYLTATKIVESLKLGIEKEGKNPNFVNLVPDPSRESANELMTAVGLVDLLIPRGGKGLIKACVENAKVPCIETGTGICHIYVDEYADFNKALKIIENAKTQRPSVCNAAETLLVNEKIASSFLPQVDKKLSEKVTFYCDEKALPYMKSGVKAIENSFDTEYLDYKMSVGIVKDVNEACKHIAKHGTHHSDAIITEDGNNAKIFTANVDSAAVYVNASTRFTDGGVFGLGCEMGISTQKLHARGPMGLSELTTYKYIVKGDGQIR